MSCHRYIIIHNSNIAAIASYNKKNEYKNASISAKNIVFENNTNIYFWKKIIILF